VPVELQRRESVDGALEQRRIIVGHSECAECEGLEVGREKQRLRLLLDFRRPPKGDQPVDARCARRERGTTRIVFIQSVEQILDAFELASAERQPDPRPRVIADVTFEAELVGGALEPRGFSLVA
jgi:hypothetical protein